MTLWKAGMLTLILSMTVGCASVFGQNISEYFEDDVQRALAEAAAGDNPLNTGAGDGAITAAAKGQPYYARPTDLAQFARRDGNFEYGNLYNPFWQPRLAKLSDVEKSAVAAIAGAK